MLSVFSIQHAAGCWSTMLCEGAILLYLTCPRLSSWRNVGLYPKLFCIYWEGSCDSSSFILLMWCIIFLMRMCWTTCIPASLGKELGLCEWSFWCVVEFDLLAFLWEFFASVFIGDIALHISVLLCLCLVLASGNSGLIWRVSFIIILWNSLKMNNRSLKSSKLKLKRYSKQMEMNIQHTKTHGIWQGSTKREVYSNKNYIKK